MPKVTDSQDFAQVAERTREVYKNFGTLIAQDINKCFDDYTPSFLKG